MDPRLCATKNADFQPPPNPQASSGPQLASDPSIAVFELERVFKDLYQGVRSEANVGLSTLPGSVDQLAAAMEAQSLSGDTFEGGGVALVDSIVRSEITEATVALSGALWLEKHESSNDSDLRRLLYASIHSHSRIVGSTLAMGPLQAARLGGGAPIANELLSNLVKRFRRYLQCVNSIGWALFTLLTLSSSFRHAASKFNRSQWDHFHTLIKENKGSFKLISKTVRPQYGAVLFEMLQDPRVKRTLGDPSQCRASLASTEWADHFELLKRVNQNPGDVFDPMATRYQMHPQRWCLAPNKEDIHPVTVPYIPIEHSMLHRPFTPEFDPRYIGSEPYQINHPGDIGGARCEICKATGAKDCGIDFKASYPEVLVELFETEGRGIGVRSLEKIRENTVLGEYAGVITTDVGSDDPYVLHGHNLAIEGNFYLITSIDQGKFTRFANHSCNSNSVLTTVPYHNKLIAAVVSVKEIGLFEEITVDYGDDYFTLRGMKCLCGTPECKIGSEA